MVRVMVLSLRSGTAREKQKKVQAHTIKSVELMTKIGSELKKN